MNISPRVALLKIKFDDPKPPSILTDACTAGELHKKLNEHCRNKNCWCLEKQKAFWCVRSAPHLIILCSLYILYVLYLFLWIQNHHSKDWHSFIRYDGCWHISLYVLFTSEEVEKRFFHCERDTSGGLDPLLIFNTLFEEFFMKSSCDPSWSAPPLRRTYSGE